MVAPRGRCPTAEKAFTRKQRKCGTLATAQNVSIASVGVQYSQKNGSNSAVIAQLNQTVALVLLPRWWLIISVIALHEPHQFHRCTQL